MVAWVPLSPEKPFPAGALRLWEVGGSVTQQYYPSPLLPKGSPLHERDFAFVLGDPPIIPHSQGVQ